jgi:hypothetical protein
MKSTQIEQCLEQIKSEAQSALGDNLLSLVLYGSRARGDAHEFSNINLLLIVKDAATEPMRALQKVVPGWLPLGALPPVIFADDQFQRSCDAFALEFVEMAAARKVLAGSDPFAAFVPDWSAVRRELEQEARQKRIDLQRRWLATGGDRAQYPKIVQDLARGFLVLLRGTLVLKQQKLESPNFDAVIAGAKQWHWFRPDFWNKLREASLGKGSMSDPEAMMNEFLEQALALAKCLDEMAM